MTLDELRRLDPKKIGTWPAAPKFGALVVLLLIIVFLGYWLDWKSQISAIDAAKKQEASLRTTFLAKKRQAINLDLYRQQLAAIQQQFGAVLKQLPGKSEMDALLTDINQAGLGRGLSFELFKPAAHETEKDFYASLPIAIKLTGSYHDIGAFASDIAKLPRIVTLNNVALSSGKDGVLTMDATAMTYRYLDEEEIAKQRQAERAKRHKKRR